jgi:hypothetical protein
MYLRSVKDKRLDRPGDLTMLPGAEAPPERPLKTPKEELYQALEKKTKPIEVPADIVTPRSGYHHESELVSCLHHCFGG